MADSTKYLLGLALAGLAAGCGSADSDWQRAQQAGTAAAYQEFLAKYPGDKNSQAAADALLTLRGQATWEEAQSQGTRSAYQNFLQEFGDQAQANDARQRLEALTRAERWGRIQTTPNEGDLTSFIDQYPDSEEAGEARELLMGIRTDRSPTARAASPAPVGTHQVQLASFRTAESAERERRRLQTLFADLAPGLTVVEPTGNARYFSVRSPLMAETAAVALCTDLKSRAQDCFVVAN